MVARVAGISRQAIYRPIDRRPAAAGPGRVGPDDEAIVEVAKPNATDGTRMVAALASRELGRPVNRKRVQRVMRAHKLLQPTRGSGRRRRPGFFRVTRPDELWHIDMTKVWTAAARLGLPARHGRLLHPGDHRLDPRAALPRRRSHRRASKPPSSPAASVPASSPSAPTTGRSSPPGTSASTCPRVGSRTGAAATATPSPRRSSSPGSASSRSAAPGAPNGRPSNKPAPRSPPTSTRYHHRPHSGLGYRTPREVAATWRGTDTIYKPERPEPTTRTGSTSTGTQRPRVPSARTGTPRADSALVEAARQLVAPDRNGFRRRHPLISSLAQLPSHAPAPRRYPRPNGYRPPPVTKRATRT